MKNDELQKWLFAELDRAYALEMTRATLRSDAEITDRDVIGFAAILGINRRYPVTQRWPHTWLCRNGVWGGW